MQKILIILMLLLTVSAIYAKDPKETKEYWAKALGTDAFEEKSKEAKEEMQKCWKGRHDYFKVKEGSRQWNICCAIQAAYSKKDKTVEQVSEYNKRLKQSYLSE